MTEQNYARFDGDGLDRPRYAEHPTAAPIVVEEDDATATRFNELGLTVPKASILPRNFAAATGPDEFVFEQMTSTLQTLGRRAGLIIEVPGPIAYRAIHEKDHEIIAPVLQFGHAFLVEGGATLAVDFLKELARHVAMRWGPTRARNRDAVIELVITRGSRAKRVTYCGPIDGLTAIVDIARDVFDEDDDDEHER